MSFPRALTPYDPFAAPSGVIAGARNYIDVVLDCGADPTGTVDSTAAFILAESFFTLDTLTGGGEIYVPRGRYIVNGWTPTHQNVRLRGAGRFATTLVGNAAGAFALRLGGTQGPRWHVSDLALDAGAARDCALSAGETAPFTGNLFTGVYFRGALVDTMRLGGVGQSWDVSLNTFIGCTFDSAAPSNSNLRVRGTNTSQTNLFITCNFGSNGVLPRNIDIADGDVQIINPYFAGATSYDIEAASGRVMVWGGDSESAGGFLHTAAADVLGYDYLPHVVEGIVLGNTGDPTIATIYHEGRRTLKLNDVSSRRSIRIGAQGRLKRDDVTFFDPAASLVFDAGAQDGDGAIFKAYKSANQNIPSDGVEHELTFDNEEIDSHGGHDGINPARYTCKKGQAGWYAPRVQVAYAGSGVGSREVMFKKNGGAYAGGWKHEVGSADGNRLIADDLIFLNDDEWISAWTAQTAGAPLDVIGGGEYFTSFYVRRVR